MNLNLFEKISDGDEHAFELLFRRYYPRLCGFACKFVLNTNEAEEIVQEVFLKIWEKRELLKSQKELKPYLFKSVQNLCLNFVRHQQAVNKYYSVIESVYKSSTNPNFDIHEQLFGEELQTKIEEIMESLPQECKRIFQMSRDEGLKYSEIAKELNISIKTVETQMSRALSQFRNELKDYLAIFIISLFLNL